MSHLSESKVKFLILFILFLFSIQEIAIYHFISEPYPALRMPPFSGNGMNEQGSYQTASVDIGIYFESGDMVAIAPKDFFFDAPGSHLLALTKKFQPADKSEKKAPYKELDFLKPIIPGLFISRNRSHFDVQHHPETLQWLRKRIKKIYPDKSPQMISFKWYRSQYHPENLLHRQRELTDSTNIEL